MNWKCLPDNVKVKHSLPYNKFKAVQRVERNFPWHPFIGTNWQLL